MFFSQEEFSFQLYLEDNIGNRDTVIIGYDELSSDSIDLSFEEINLIDSTWSTPLEGRVSHQSVCFGSAPVYLTKKYVAPRYLGTVEFHLDIGIYFRCDNFPLKVSWDSSLFKTSDLYLTMISGDCSSHYCSDFMTSDFKELSYCDSLIFQETNWPMPELSHIENGINIYKLSFAFNDDQTYCGWGKMNENNLISFEVFPNPTIELIQLNLGNIDEKINYSIIDGLGQIVKTDVLTGTTIDIHDLAAGHYLLKLISDNNNYNIRTFIKLN